MQEISLQEIPYRTAIFVAYVVVSIVLYWVGAVAGSFLELERPSDMWTKKLIKDQHSPRKVAGMLIVYICVCVPIIRTTYVAYYHTLEFDFLLTSIIAIFVAGVNRALHLKSK